MSAAVNFQSPFFILTFYTCKLKFTCNFLYLEREDFQVVWNCSFTHMKYDVVITLVSKLLQSSTPDI